MDNLSYKPKTVYAYKEHVLIPTYYEPKLTFKELCYLSSIDIQKADKKLTDDELEVYRGFFTRGMSATTQWRLRKKLEEKGFKFDKV